MDTHHEEEKENKEFWNVQATFYEGWLDYGTMQGSMSLYNFALAKRAKRILEIGVGTGLAPRLFATMFMQPGSVYFNGDLSPKMVEIFKKNFDRSGLNDITNLNFKVLEEKSMYEIPQPSEETSNLKQIYAHVANACKLPYPDESFDRYFSTSTINSLDSPDKMLSEAYRVLEKGGKIGISIRGRRVHSLFIDIGKQATEKAGFVFDTGMHDYFYLSENEVLKDKVIEAGFTNVRFYYANNNFMFTSKDELWEYQLKTTYNSSIASFSKEDQDKIRKCFDEIYDENYEKDPTLLNCMEIIICVGDKE
jgi:ubiquinone/menaquinone biosynthesis C-methylase UbiE